MIIDRDTFNTLQEALYILSKNESDEVLSESAKYVRDYLVEVAKDSHTNIGIPKRRGGDR